MNNLGSQSGHLIIPLQVGSEGQLLDRLDIGHEVVQLVLVVVDSRGVVDEGETHHVPPLQAPPQNHSLFCIEGIVDHLQGEVVHRWGAVEEISDRSIELGVDFILRVGNFLPPPTAHEEQGEDEKGSTHAGQHLAAPVLLMSFIANDIEGCLIQRDRLASSQFYFGLVESWKALHVYLSRHLVASEGISPVVYCWGHGVGCNCVKDGSHPADSDASPSSSPSNATVVMISKHPVASKAVRPPKGTAVTESPTMPKPPSISKPSMMPNSMAANSMASNSMAMSDSMTPSAVPPASSSSTSFSHQKQNKCYTNPDNSFLCYERQKEKKRQIDIDNCTPLQDCWEGQLLDWLDVGHEVVVLGLFAVQAFGVVDESKTHHVTALHALAKDHCFLSIEGVVDHLHDQVVHRRGTAEEVAYRSVGLNVDFEKGINYLLPPVAAHEEKRKNQKRSTHYREKQTTPAAFLNFITYNVEGSLVDRDLLACNQ